MADPTVYYDVTEQVRLSLLAAEGKREAARALLDEADRLADRDRTRPILDGRR